jgi:hypothetical protein
VKSFSLKSIRAEWSSAVRAVGQLTLENQQLREMRAGTGGSVVPFPGRVPARPRN